MYGLIVMNWKTILVAGALCGSCYAAETAEAQPQAVEQAANKTMAVYVLKAQSFG